MRKFLCALNNDTDIEMFYLEGGKIAYRNNRFAVGYFGSPGVGRPSSDFLKLERNEYKSILSHVKFKKLVEIIITLREYSWNIEDGSEAHEKGLKLMEKANKIIELLDSKENEELEKNIKLLTMKNEDKGLSRNELIEICEHFGVETINTETIIAVYEDKKEYGEEAFQLHFESFSHNSNNGYLENVLANHFDYEGFADEMIEEREEIFETSEGQVVELDSDWLP